MYAKSLDPAIDAGPPYYWPRDAFFSEQLGNPCPEVIDLTGRPRILVFGPFLPLPAGRWRAKVDFELCAEGATRPFLVEFGPFDGRFNTAFQPQSAGRQVLWAECEMARSWDVEIRLSVARPTFHGELRFLGATIERAPPLNVRPR